VAASSPGIKQPGQQLLLARASHTLCRTTARAKHTCSIPDPPHPPTPPPHPLQVEFADVIVLNKTDLVSSEQQQLLHALLRKLNPSARIVSTSHSQVDVSQVRCRAASADVAAGAQLRQEAAPAVATRPCTCRCILSHATLAMNWQPAAAAH
jgi:hypothetical protein